MPQTFLLFLVSLSFSIKLPTPVWGFNVPPPRLPPASCLKRPPFGGGILVAHQIPYKPSNSPPHKHVRCTMEARAGSSNSCARSPLFPGVLQIDVFSPTLVPNLAPPRGVFISGCAEYFFLYLFWFDLFAF